MTLKTAVVAGHICLDILPDLSRLPAGQFSERFQPGQLLLAGPAAFSTGGPVSNTGLALHKLGIPTRLVAKVGRDAFGGIVRDLVAAISPDLPQGIVVDAVCNTSYSVIISPPGVDRIFLHSPGANDTFTAADIDYSLAEGADLFHFGYPPIMRQMYVQNGRNLAEVLARAKAAGASTSLDMAFPDPSSESGQANWHVILSAALPYVDLFMPSIEELLFMLFRDRYEQLEAQGGVLPALSPGLLDEVSDGLFEMGAKIVGLKLGERGFYLRVAEEGRLAGMGRAAPADLAQWAGKRIWEPCFQVDVVGTTGSGDATIAGFLAALLRDMAPEEAARMAVAVGACNVEAADALSGIRSWEETRRRIAAGWQRRSTA